MNKALSQLISLSNTVGKDTSLVQGGGGNTSTKTDDGKYMYVKASGTALKDMSEKVGWRRMRLDAACAVMQDKSMAKMDTFSREAEVVNQLQSACDDNFIRSARPTVEAHMHAFLDKCIIHLHPDVVLAYACAKNGQEKLQKLFEKEKFPPLWMSYADPGYTLAKKLEKLTADYKAQYGRGPAVIFMQSHGLVISAKTPEAALRILRRVINRCTANLKKPASIKIKPVSRETINEAKLCIRKAFFEATGQYTMISYFCNNAVTAFYRQKNAPAMLRPQALTPDELLYAIGPAIWVESLDPKKIAAKLAAQIKRDAKPSPAFLVKPLGLFVAADTKIASAITELVLSSFFIRTNASRYGGIVSLNKGQRDFINQWESEAFRKKLALGSCQGQLQGRIAFVTGAGSGLGRSIAVGLARAGAAVALADIDERSARATSELIKNELPGAQAIALKCDVTNEASVEDAFNGLLEDWGGLDIAVNAAGVAPPGPLVEMPIDKFRFALEINLVGYAICAKAAAKIMKDQAIGGSIINISSKSGLEASKDNTPYNATKAGQLHMARGWAMELGQYGIRVNSVAPGNVFEGSKIWNPQYIKACAKKYGIKPEEVLGYYIDKTSLKREIKGQDVADSVVFLCSDNARTITGQTIVTDSGQVMVR